MADRVVFFDTTLRDGEQTPGVNLNITEKVQSIEVNTKNEKRKPVKYDEVDLEQISLFDTVRDEDVLKELQEIEITNLTPMDALNTLYRLQNKLKNRWQS